MKKFFVAMAALIFLASISYASPFIACEPYPSQDVQPQYFYVSIDGATPVKGTWTVDPLGWKLYDLVGISVGQHQVKIKACIEDMWGINGEACSAEAVFNFTRPPSTLSTPTLKLLK
jgi:hypothetical protein